MLESLGIINLNGPDSRNSICFIHTNFGILITSHKFGNLLSFFFLLRCGTRPYERGTQ